jgi:hypothetical protein
MAYSGRGDSILSMVFPATMLALVRAAPLKPSVRRLLEIQKNAFGKRQNHIDCLATPL